VNAYELLEQVRFRELARRLYDVQIAGAKHVPASGPVILVANHESMFDPWLLALVTPRPVRYMAKSELWRHRPVARVLESFGAFPVERGTGDATAISIAAGLLRDGEVLGMFPQGTSKRRPSRPYHRGAARLALATGAPVVPVRMIGTRGLPRPGRPPVEIVVEEPIAVEAAKPTVAAAKDLTRRLEQTIAGAPA
jgi:1-acyl-sn-glycerol-3-phosphate acyltransferase